MSESCSETSTSSAKEKEPSSPPMAAFSEWTRLRGLVRDHISQTQNLELMRALSALELMLTIAPAAELAIAERNEEPLALLWVRIRDEVAEILDRQYKIN
jgi:hypothetical protein